MSESKIILGFGNSQRAKAFVERAKKLPFVTYAIDYVGAKRTATAMICGEFTPEQEELIKSRKI